MLGALARSGDSCEGERQIQERPRPHLVSADDLRKAESDPGVRVVVVDDHELLRRGIHELFGSVTGVEVVGEAATGAEALDVLARIDADVVVLDVRLPDADGVDICRELRSRHPELRCLILTSYDADEALFAAVAAGAAGFLIKDVSGSELVDTVRRVGNGERLIDRELSRAVFERVAVEMADRERLESLTPQERRIFDLVAEGSTNREIGEQLFLAEKTVRNYVSNVLAKLTLKRRAELAAFAARVRRNHE